MSGGIEPRQEEDFRDKRVTVMGLGGFGGGVGVTRYLAAQGARVTVTDLKTADALRDSLEQLAGLALEFHLSGHRESDFAEADVVVVNPAVPPDSRFVKLAAERGVALDTEMNLFVRRCPAPVAAVTGSDGKSTTTSLLAAMLRGGARPVWCGGNLGVCLLDRLGEIGRDDLVVLELSSFQLERLAWTRRSPHLALALNVNPNHFDWHKGMAAYVAAKKNILRFQGAGDFAVLNADDTEVNAWGAETRARVFGFSGRSRRPRSFDGAFLRGDGIVLRASGPEERIALTEFKLRGEHNRLNAAAAALAARLLGAAPEAIARAAARFAPLPHRLELVGEIGGVRYFNDSKATTPVAAMAALRSFDEPLVLIAGGHDKLLPFGRFGRMAARRAKAVILLGEAAGKIERAIPRRIGGGAEVLRAGDLADAVRSAARLAAPGDAVLLSPACASYDMFRNFEERGDVFRALVKALADGKL